MRRTIIGLVILVLVFLTGLWTEGRLKENLRGDVPTLSQAAGAAATGDWVSAGNLLQAAHNNWTSHRHFTAAVTDHAPMEGVDIQYARLFAHLAHRQAPEFTADCQELISRLEEFSDSHRLSWWNLL